MAISKARPPMIILHAVSLSGNGSTVAISSPGHHDNLGHVRIFELKDNNWEQIGNDIDGKGRYLKRYFSSLSSDGLTVAIGSDLNMELRGNISIYRYVDSNWDQLGNDIIGILYMINQVIPVVFPRWINSCYWSYH